MADGNRADGNRRLTSRWWRGPGRLVAVAYLAPPAGLATAGVIAGSGWLIAAALLLTLPLGLVALAGTYLGYAVLQGVGGLFASTTTAAGDQAGWLAFSTGVLIVVLVLAAAIGNLVLLSLVAAAHRRGSLIG
jgi:hypothetical protein